MLIDCLKLRCAVDSTGLAHKQFAERAGVSRNTISAVLNSDIWNMKAETVAKICSVLGLQPSDILMHRDDLIIRFAELSKKRKDMENDGLTEAADIISKEIEKLEKFLI